MVKVSVIVAVYQVEAYIKQCLDSLQNQTLCDFEVLLIDDGSTDKSGLICDEYAKTDSRFRVFHKKNEGIGSVRQFGLEKSTGEYVIHVDPDDWVESTMLEELYSCAKKESADIVICDYFLNQKNKTIYKKQEPDLSSEHSYFQDLINKLYGSCWNKLVRKSCFKQYGISFRKDMVLWEDKLVNLKLAEQKIKVVYLPKAFYHYVARNNSAIRKCSKKRVYSVIYFIDWLEKREKLCDKKWILNFKRFVKHDAFGTPSINKNEFMNIYPELNETFSFKLWHIGRTTDFYIIMALKYNFNFFRKLYLLKMKVSNKIASINLIK